LPGQEDGIGGVRRSSMLNRLKDIRSCEIRIRIVQRQCVGRRVHGQQGNRDSTNVEIIPAGQHNQPAGNDGCNAASESTTHGIRGTPPRWLVIDRDFASSIGKHTHSTIDRDGRQHTITNRTAVIEFRCSRGIRMTLYLRSRSPARSIALPSPSRADAAPFLNFSQPSAVAAPACASS
jgi:hypothetical protein